MKSLVLVLMVTGCGTSSHEGGNVLPTQDPTQVAPSDTPTAQIAPQSTPEPSSTVPPFEGAKVVESDHVPVCNADAEGDLVYVQDHKQFQYCETGSWVPIDLTGASGTPGKDGTPVPGNEWLDPVTNVTWFLGGQGTYNQATQACTGKFRLPTETEAQLAYLQAIPAHPDMWTSTAIQAGGHYIGGQIQTIPGTNQYDYSDNGVHGITCVGL